MEGHLSDHGVPAEPDAHVMSRHLQVGLRALVVAFLLGTVLTLVMAPDAAYLVAVPIPLLYAVLIVTNHYERRSRVTALRHAEEPDRLTPEEIEVDEEVAGFATGVKITGALALAAFLVAATLFEWKMVGMVTAGFLLYMVLVGLPVWLAAISDARDDEHERTTGESRGIR